MHKIPISGTELNRRGLSGDMAVYPKRYKEA